MIKKLFTYLMIVLAGLLLLSTMARAQTWGSYEEADKRIEQYRKGDFTIIVTDEAGNIISNAAIEVNMKKHAFLFGSEVKAGLVFGPYAIEQYRATFLELFNSGTFSSDLKWGPWEGEWDQSRFKTSEYLIPGNPFDRERTMGALAWFKENDLFFRAHGLIWPKWNYMPLFLEPYHTNSAGLPEVIINRIRDVTSATKDYVYEWDVVNEPATCHDVMDIFGDSIMVDWFETAREELPDCKLFINENGILLTAENLIKVEQEIQYLLDHNAPLDGIGIQGHMEKDSQLDPAIIFYRISRFSKFGLDIRITEFDHEGINEQQQAQYLHDFFITVFSHPGVSGIQMWGFWEGSHWRPQRALYRKDWSIKPNGLAYKDLVFNRWWSNFQGNTDSQGKFQGRGFLGSYEIKVIHHDSTFSKTFDLEKNSNEVIFQLKPEFSTSIRATDSNHWGEFMLQQNYPNPFNATTAIVYVLPRDGFVNLSIYNLLGKTVRCLVNRSLSAGRYISNWDGADESGNNVASGLYLCKLESEFFQKINKMTLLK
ncbi:MAG: endo-1,4-beta-xylanase [Candidatus Zhuqueibacterota bacterium]